jgi:hypothetical protein
VNDKVVTPYLFIYSFVYWYVFYLYTNPWPRNTRFLRSRGSLNIHLFYWSILSFLLILRHYYSTSPVTISYYDTTTVRHTMTLLLYVSCYNLILRHYYCTSPVTISYYATTTVRLLLQSHTTLLLYVSCYNLILRHYYCTSPVTIS